MNEIIATRRSTLVLGIVLFFVAIGFASLLFIPDVHADKGGFIPVAVLALLFFGSSIFCIVYRFIKPLILIELQDSTKLIINKSKTKKEVLEINSITHIDADNHTYRGHTYSYGILRIHTKDDCYIVKDVKELKTTYLILYELCKDYIILEIKQELAETDNKNYLVIAKRTSIARILLIVLIAIIIICGVVLIFRPGDWIVISIAGSFYIAIFLIFIIMEMLKIKEVIILSDNKLLINISKKEKIELSFYEIIDIEVLVHKKKSLDDCPLKITLTSGREIILKNLSGVLMIRDELKAILEKS